jgi:hypothetical protein
MELHLQPLAPACVVSGEPFVEGARVACFLVRTTTTEVVRYDLLEAQSGNFSPEGFVVCRWVHVFKPRKLGENADRELKLTAENLFVTLADPLTEPTPESTRLLQFLALMLERKRIVRPKGRSADRERNVYEHTKTKLLYEVPLGELTPEFFVAVQEQLSVLVGSPKPKNDAAGEAGPREAAGRTADQTTATTADIL